MFYILNDSLLETYAYHIKTNLLTRNNLKISVIDL
jgi:hypothetical protein